MEVILQKDFPTLGYVGDYVKVRGGYARNYLIPRGIALESSSHNKKLLKHLLGGISARKAKLKVEAEQVSQRLNLVVIEQTLKAGGKGKTFGSVSVKDIESALVAQGFVIDKRQIRIVESFRKSGEYKVPVKLHSEVTAHITLKVNVVSTGPVAAAAESTSDVVQEKKAAKARKSKKTVEAEAAQEVDSTKEEVN